jgi:hypothetical protein
VALLEVVVSVCVGRSATGPLRSLVPNLGHPGNWALLVLNLSDTMTRAADFNNVGLHTCMPDPSRVASCSCPLCAIIKTYIVRSFSEVVRRIKQADFKGQLPTRSPFSRQPASVYFSRNIFRFRNSLGFGPEGPGIVACGARRGHSGTGHGIAVDTHPADPQITRKIRSWGPKFSEIFRGLPSPGPGWGGHPPDPPGPEYFTALCAGRIPTFGIVGLPANLKKKRCSPL